MRRCLPALLTLVALLTAVVPAFAVVPGRIDAAPLAADALAVRHFALPATNQLAAEDKAAAAADEPFRFAVAAETALTPRNAGRWTTDAAGRAVWRLRLVSPGALSLNLGFVTCDLPPLATLALRPTAGGDGWVFPAADLAPGQSLWTPVVLTDDLVVEVTCLPADRDRVALELSRVNQGYRWFGEEPAAKSGTCNIDVVCPEGDPWRQEIRSVGVYTLSGSWKCSGAMVNNTDGDGAPLFLTANHCEINAVNDQTVVVYWNYQSPVCGQHGGGSLADNQAGSTLLAKSATSDFCLIRLDDAPDPGWLVTFAGWNRADAAPTSAVTIHQPSTDEKSISFDNDPLTITSYTGTTVPGDGTHLRIGAWDQGTTEPGSSGAPLFDQGHRIVGQLHGGYAACSLPNESDWYGRLAVSWQGDGSDSTRLSTWLDPTGTGAMTVNLYDPVAGVLEIMSADQVAFQGGVGGPFAPAQAVITLANSGSAAITWTAAAGAGWVGVTPASGFLDVGAQADVAVALTAAAAALPRGTVSTTVEFVNTSGGAGGGTVTATLAVLDAQPLLVSVGPNPFRGYTTVTYSLGVGATVHGRVYDLRGRMAADLGFRTADVGENTWTWDGRDGDGRHQPGGTYVLELETQGRTLRVPLTLVH